MGNVGWEAYWDAILVKECGGEYCLGEKREMNS
jgi:hypothetical protein